MKRRSTNAPVRKCERLTLVGLRRGKDKPKKYLGELIRKYLELLQLIEDMILDRNVWR